MQQGDSHCGIFFFTLQDTKPAWVYVLSPGGNKLNSQQTHQSQTTFLSLPELTQFCRREKPSGSHSPGSYVRKWARVKLLKRAVKSWDRMWSLLEPLHSIRLARAGESAITRRWFRPHKQQTAGHSSEITWKICSATDLIYEKMAHCFIFYSRSLKSDFSHVISFCSQGETQIQFLFFL